MIVNLDAYIAELRTWIGTPFKHAGRTKGPEGGVDCGNLLALSAINIGLPVADTGEYADTDRLGAIIAFLKDYCEPVAVADILKHGPEPGDILLFRGRRIMHHMGCITKEQTMIHAWRTSGINKVVEVPVPQDWWDMLHSAWRPRQEL